jgi:signal transduction histidine kinase
MGLELFIINLAAALCVLFFAGLVVRTGLGTPLNRRFASFLLALFCWLGLNYFSNQTFILYDILLWINRLLFIASILAITTMLRFCLSIHSEKISHRMDIVLGLMTGVAIVLALTPSVVESIDSRDLVVGVTFGTSSLFYFAILSFLAIGVIATLLHDTIKAKGVVRARARALLTAFGIGLGVAGVTNGVLPALFNLFYLSAVGSLVVVVMLSGVGYSIIKHKLFDIRLFVARSLAYIFAISVLVIIYVLITIVLLSQIAGQSVSLVHELPYFATALFLGFTFQPIKKFFDKISDRIFYKENYDVQDVLNRFSKLVLGEVRLDKLIDGTMALITESLKADYVSIILVDREGKIVESWSTGMTRVHNMAELINDIQKTDRSMLVLDRDDPSELKKDRLLRNVVSAMYASDAQIIVRLKTPSSNSIGYVLIGHKRSDGVYTSQDVRLLELISGELAVTVENGLRFKEIQNFNETLQDKVDTATQKLRRANAQLQRLDEAKDDFLSMASHQLRTPLTSVKGYLSMVLEGDVGKITDTQKQLLGEAFTSSERMVHLINDFLNVSRLQTGKFMLENRAINLAKVVGQEVDSLQTTAGAHNMKLRYRMPSHFPILYLDESKIRQVVMNFIDNAIYYSRENSTITTSLDIEDGFAILKVHDTGIGVPAAEQAHLFTKFFRATNARKQRPDGTGVGLFLSKKVIDAHGGSMLFESVEGEGSTFGFRLPIKKLSEVPADESDKLVK